MTRRDIDHLGRACTREMKSAYVGQSVVTFVNHERTEDFSGNKSAAVQYLRALPPQPLRQNVHLCTSATRGPEQFKNIESGDAFEYL